jgi:hypothetical protein
VARRPVSTNPRRGELDAPQRGRPSPTRRQSGTERSQPGRPRLDPLERDGSPGPPDAATPVSATRLPRTDQRTRIRPQPAAGNAGASADGRAAHADHPRDRQPTACRLSLAGARTGCADRVVPTTNGCPIAHHSGAATGTNANHSGPGTDHSGSGAGADDSGPATTTDRGAPSPGANANHCDRSPRSDTNSGAPAPGAESHQPRGDNAMTRFTRTLARPLLPVLVAALAALPFGPANAAGGDQPPPSADDNIAIATNHDDGSVVFEFAFSVRRDSDGIVDEANIAAALASCTDCTTVAVAFQAVLATRDVDLLVPINAAVATNDQCVGCFTYASATQLVFGFDGSVRITGQGRHRLHAVERFLRYLQDHAAELTPGQIVGAINAAKAEFTSIMTEDVVEVGRAHRPAAEPATSAPAAPPSTVPPLPDPPGDTTIPPQTPTGSAQPTPTGSAEPTTTGPGEPTTTAQPPQTEPPGTTEAATAPPAAATETTVPKVSAPPAPTAPQPAATEPEQTAATTAGAGSP